MYSRIFAGSWRRSLLAPFQTDRKRTLLVLAAPAPEPLPFWFDDVRCIRDYRLLTTDTSTSASTSTDTDTDTIPFRRFEHCASAPLFLARNACCRSAGDWGHGNHTTPLGPSKKLVSCRKKRCAIPFCYIKERGRWQVSLTRILVHGDRGANVEAELRKIECGTHPAGSECHILLHYTSPL